MSGEGPACPFCGSDHVELVSAWGGQLITSHVRCRDCLSYFEALRDDLARAPAGPRPPSA